MAIVQVQDHGLWVATNTQEGAGALRRFDGANWRLAVSDLPTINCIAEDIPGQQLLIGTGNGLLRLPLYPSDEFAIEDVATLTGQDVLALHRETAGSWLVGTSTGLVRLTSTGGAQPMNLPVQTAVRAIADVSGALVIGSDLGLRPSPGSDDFQQCC